LKGELSSNITSLILPDDAWYIKASQRLSFDKIFDSLSPIAGKLTGARVKPVILYFIILSCKFEKKSLFFI
jgi:hypothetical protein